MNDGRSSRGESRELKRLATLSRGRNGDEFRVTLEEFLPLDGPPAQFVSVRVWYRTDAGEMRPGKSGTTVRRAELARVISALQEAVRMMGASPAPSHLPTASSERHERGAREPARSGDLTGEDRSADMESF